MIQWLHLRKWKAQRNAPLIYTLHIFLRTGTLHLPFMFRSGLEAAAFTGMPVVMTSASYKPFGLMGWKRLLQYAHSGIHEGSSFSPAVEFIFVDSVKQDI
jgi:gamma-glutamyltranspeptidase